MALFTDGPVSTVDDLAEQDSSVLEVASTEGIDVSRKLALAQDEVEMELTALLPRAGVAAGLDNIVVTTPLRLWHTFHSLALVYRDAFHSQLNDRYRGRWEEYGKLARWAAAKLVQAGMGMVSDPLPKAAQPELAAVPGTLGETILFVSAAWVNGAGEEGCPSAPASSELTGGSTLRITPRWKPSKANAWNVYVGFSPDEMRRQNDTPIAPGASWTVGGSVRTDGEQPQNGQSPNYVRALARVLDRG